MDNRQKINNFINNYKKTVQLEPKFKVGDIILNNWKGKKIISEIVKVYLFIDKDDKNFNKIFCGDLEAKVTFYHNMDYNKPYWLTFRELIGEYVIRDIINEHKLDPNNIVNKKLRTRRQYIQKVDLFYSVVDPRAARVLYGINTESKTKDKK